MRPSGVGKLCAVTSTLDTACYECRSGTRLLASTCDALEQQIGLEGLEGLARRGNTTACTCSIGGSQNMCTQRVLSLWLKTDQAAFQVTLAS